MRSFAFLIFNLEPEATLKLFDTANVVCIMSKYFTRMVAWSVYCVNRCDTQYLLLTKFLCPIGFHCVDSPTGQPLLFSIISLSLLNNYILFFNAKSFDLACSEYTRVILWVCLARNTAAIIDKFNAYMHNNYYTINTDEKWKYIKHYIYCTVTLTKKMTYECVFVPTTTLCVLHLAVKGLWVHLPIITNKASPTPTPDVIPSMDTYGCHGNLGALVVVTFFNLEMVPGISFLIYIRYHIICETDFCA